MEEFDSDTTMETTKEATSSSSSIMRMNRLPESLVPELESLSYDPVHFLRAHSKRDNPCDNQTQVSCKII